MISRRKFLIHAGIAGAGACLFNRGHAAVQEFSQFPSFDLHAHPGLFMNKGVTNYRGDEAVLKTIRDMAETNTTGCFAALVADSPLLEMTPTGIKVLGAYKKGDGAVEYKRQIRILKTFLKALEILPSEKAVDFEKRHEAKKPAIFISCEGGDFLEDRTDLLDEMYAEGVRSMQVVHYAPSLLGDLQTQPEQHNGLSAAGKAVVKKMNALHMLVDVAHASFKTVQDVVSITDSPIMLSHSILAMDADRPIAARAISTEHAKAVASTGGIVGAWPSGFNKSFDEFGDNILRLIDAIGIDHVGIGTDMDANFKPVLDSYKQMPALAELLRKKGLIAAEVSKVMDGNAKRVIRKVLG